MLLGDFSFGKKCVCDIKEKEGEYGNKLYFYSCNGEWLMDSHCSCYDFVLFRVW
jgi:hypothetical protein